MSVVQLRQRAVQAGARLLLVGQDQARLEHVAQELRHDGLRSVGVVGSGDLAPAKHPRLAAIAALLRAREPNRVRDGIHALDLAVDPVRFAVALHALGDADAVIAGPGIDAGRLAEAALWTLGPSVDARGGVPASASWLPLDDGRLIACADCCFEVPADAGGVAQLALAASRLAAQIAERPRVSFLIGPNGNAAAAAAVLAAFEALAPGIPAVVDRKVAIEPGEARYRGRAEVLIFPGSAAAHLAARTTRALSGARLLGPVLLGLPGVVAATSDDADDGELGGTAALAALLAARTTS